MACAALRTAGAEDGREAACSIGRGGLPCCGYPHASAAPCRREGWGGFCRRGRDKHTGGAAYRADRAVSAEKAGGCRSRAGPAARTAAWKGPRRHFVHAGLRIQQGGPRVCRAPQGLRRNRGSSKGRPRREWAGCAARRRAERDGSGSRAGLCCPSGRMEPAGMRRHGRVLGSTRVCPARAWLPGLSPDRRRRRSRVPAGAWCRRGCRERPR